MRHFTSLKIVAISRLTCVAIAILTAQAALGQTWTGGSTTDGNWTDPANWSGGVPGGLDTATFDSSIQNGWGTSTTPIVIDTANQPTGGINFTGAADNYTIGSTTGNSFLLSSGSTVGIDINLTSTNATETINAPIVIDASGGLASFENFSANGTGAGAGTLNFGGAISGNVTGATVLTLDGSNTNNNTISGVISNGSATSLSIAKNSVGNWVLTGANTYTGNTTVNAGTLTLAAPSGSVLGNNGSPTSSNSTTTIASGATLNYNATGGSFRQAGVNFAGTGTLNIVAGANTVTFGGNGGSSTPINWGFSAGAVINVVSGELVGGYGNTDNWSSNQASLNVAAGATFQGSETGGNGQPAVQFDALTGGGTIEGGFSNNPIYTIGVANGSGTFSGVIENQSQPGYSGGRLGITKVGTGTETLAGNNTYTERTTVNGGTLSVTGSLANNNVDYDGGHNYSVIVNSGGTLMGSGTVGSTQVNGGGNLTTGGVQTLGAAANGNLTLSNTSVLSPNLLDVASSASLASPALTFALGASGTSSKIVAGGTGANIMNFNDGNSGLGATVVAINDLVGAGLNLSTEYVLIQGNGSTTYLDNGNALTLGQVEAGLGQEILGGLVLDSSFSGGAYADSELFFNGNNIDIYVVPEPSTWVLMLGGLGLLVYWQRQRGRRTV